MPKNSNPKVSVIIVSYNTHDITERCLLAVINSDYGNVETIVVDNLSQDKTVEMIRQKFKSVKLLIPEKNLGYGGGNNLGMQQASGDYF